MPPTTEPATTAVVRPRVAWVLAAGLIAIFAANAVAAVVDPSSYRHILEASPLSRAFGLHHHRWAVLVIALNDGAIAAGIAVSLVVGDGRRMMAIAGLWLAIAAVLKVSASVG